MEGLPKRVCAETKVRTFLVGRSITVQLTFSLTGLEMYLIEVVSIKPQQLKAPIRLKHYSEPVKQEVSCAVILPLSIDSQSSLVNLETRRMVPLLP